jgi:phytoene desaturase
MRREAFRKPLPLVLFIASVLTVLPSCKGEDPPPPPLEELGPGAYDVVVIGAGGGGISAAAKLAMGGMKVLVIEQHDKVGGYMTSFERGDYRFEVSLHAMDGLGRELFPKLGIQDKVKTVRLDPAYRSIFPDFTFDVPADPQVYRERLKGQFPQEAQGIDRLFDDLELIYEGMRCLMNLQDGKGRGATIWRIVKKPRMFWPMIKYWDKNCSDMLADYIQDEKLIALFLQLMAYTGTSADEVSGMFFAMMWISYHHVGFYYFEGGSQAVTNALAEVVRENGGQILLNTLATKIVIEDGAAVAVQTKDGKEFKCRYVVSNANAPDTFFKLVGREYLPKDYVGKLEKMVIGLPAFAVYLGVDHDFSKTFPEGIHSYFVNPGYDQKEIFQYFREGNPEKAMFGLINYTMVDPTDAPKGKNVIAVVSIMPYDYKGDWYESESYEKYSALKEEVARIYLNRAEKLVPGLREHIEVMEVGSPRTMEHYTLNPRGSIFGWEFSKEQSMMKRLPQKTPIRNLYLAGAWTFPGGGQSAVLMGGELAGNTILGREK